MLTETELRLELLKLTYTHGRPAAEAVGRAEELLKFVRPPETNVLPTGKQETLHVPVKKSNNPFKRAD